MAVQREPSALNNSRFFRSLPLRRLQRPFMVLAASGDKLPDRYVCSVEYGIFGRQSQAERDNQDLKGCSRHVKSTCCKLGF